MHNRRWYGVGLLGIALAGTIALVIPSEAQTGAMLARNDVATRQPDRAVQQEAQAIASHLEDSMRRGAALLQTLADGDLAVFERDRVALNAATSQWPVALFTATPGKGSDMSVQPPGERYLSSEDVQAIQKQDVWISERSPLKSVLVAVPSRTGQVLASRVPFDYFTQGLNALPRANGVRRYLLDVGGKAISGDVAPGGDDRDWCQQLLQMGEGFLATSDALFAVARVPSTGWAVVVRHPLGSNLPPLTFDGTLGGPTMVASGPLQAPGLPKGILLYPLAGAALLFGLAIVGWKQRWPGMEDGPIAFGENAFKTVTAPLRDRFDRRSPSEPLLPSSETGLATFAAEVPSKLPAAIAGDVDFLRTEQVRNLRELWSHTEERLSGQRNWVREEVRRVQDSTTASISELGSIVNLAEQRLEDARSAWGEVQASLLARIDETRAGLASEQESNEDYRASLHDQLSGLRNALVDEREEREDQGKRLAKGLGDLATGLESGLAQEREAHQALSERMERDLDALSTLMNEEFARLEGILQASRSLVAELDAREADSRAQWQAALATQSERTDRVEAELAAAREALVAELEQKAQELQALVADTQSQLGGEVSAIADRAGQIGQSLGALEARLAEHRTGLDERLGELQALVQEALPPLRAELESLRDLSGSVEQISHRLDAHAERFEGLSALEHRLLDLGQRMDQRFQELDVARRSFDERVEAANARVLEQADELEETNERLYDHEQAVTRLNHEQQQLGQRLERADDKLAELAKRAADQDRTLGEVKALPTELAGLKGRLEGMSLAHARQQEALNAAVKQLAGLQEAFQARTADTGLQSQVEELTTFVQQLAEQSQLLAQALDASTTAASRTEEWLGEQLSQIRSEQSEAVSALTHENAALRTSLQALKESNEALSNRMHMVVQVLSKISK